MSQNFSKFLWGRSPGMYPLLLYLFQKRRDSDLTCVEQFSWVRLWMGLSHHCIVGSSTTSWARCGYLTDTRRRWITEKLSNLLQAHTTTERESWDTDPTTSERKAHDVYHFSSSLDKNIDFPFSAIPLPQWQSF